MIRARVHFKMENVFIGEAMKDQSKAHIFLLLGALKGPSMIKGPVESHAIVLFDVLRGPSILKGLLETHISSHRML